MKSLSLAAAAFALAVVIPAVATGGTTLFDTTFAKLGSPCFERTYDAAHLKAHPHQTVSGISLEYSATNDDGTPNKPDAFELSLSFHLKPADGWFSGPATCKTVGDHFACALDGDEGQFTVTPQAGALKFTVVNRGGTDSKEDQIHLEGGDSSASFGKPSGDDLVFVLPKVASSVCQGGGY